MRTLFVLIFLFGLLNTYAQDTLLLYGKIVSGSKPMYNVTVENTATHTGTISDFEGNFSVKAQPSDTIRFSSIGYKPITYILADSFDSPGFRVMVNMVEDTVLLAETVIVPWPVNRTMLKQAMLENKKEKETIGAFAGFREIEGDPEEPEPKFTNPISFLYDKFSKKARQQKKMQKYREMLQEDEYFETQAP